MDDSADIRDAGRLTGDALAGIVGAIGHTHKTVSGRVFDTIGPVAGPVRLFHDGLTGGVYAIVTGAHAAVPRAGAMVAAERSRRRSADDPETAEPERQPWSPTNRPVRVLGVLNGLKGQIMAADYPALAFPMTLRDHVNGGNAEPTSTGLATAYPEATERLAVFVHGLCETDRSWWDGATKHHGRATVSYGTMLADDLGYTPVYLRYNSGLPIADNGRSLADLLDQVVRAWPVPVRNMVLVGHSMGGLVARSACHRAGVDGRSWADLVGHVICVGTPHLGAPLEQGVHRLVPVLDHFPETRPLARFLHDRSPGVKDLRHGLLAGDDDAVDDDPDEFHGDDPERYLTHRRREVPFLAGATYCFVGATVTHDRDHPLGRLVGDLLVTYPSASGSNRHRTIPFELDNGAHVGGINHFDLLNHPTVYRQLHRWLTPIDPGPPSS